MCIERLRQTYDVEICFVHFPLHPETPAEGQTLEQLFAGRPIGIPAAQAHMKKLMAAEGLPYGNRTMTYNSLLAQEMATWAVGRGSAGDLIHDALFRAYFVNSVNTGVVDSLVAIAEQIGLSPVECREVLQLRRFRAAVHADWERRRRRGVTRVPTFAIGSSEVVGAQPYEVLEKLVLNAGVSPRK